MKQKEFPNFEPPIHATAKMPKDYHALAKQRGFIWVGLPVRTAVTKTAWACSKGHIWKAAYNTIHQGSGCPYCSGKARKISDDYQSLAKSKGIVWIAKNIPRNTDTKTYWQCEQCQYEWDSSYQNVSLGSGCPKCRQKEIADGYRLSPDDYHRIAELKGVHWIGEPVQTANDKTLWYCPDCENEWLSTYTYIREGIGCPLCLDFVNGNRVSQQQRAIAQLVDGEINTKLGRKYIDVLIIRDGLRIAIEYDSWYWHGKRQEADARRDRVFIEAGYRIIHIHSNELLPTVEQLQSAIDAIVAGADIQIITLSDWGIGNCFDDYRSK